MAYGPRDFHRDERPPTTAEAPGSLPYHAVRFPERIDAQLLECCLRDFLPTLRHLPIEYRLPPGVETTQVWLEGIDGRHQQ